MNIFEDILFVSISFIISLAVGCIPLLKSRKIDIVNPNFLVFVILFFSLSLKSLYIVVNYDIYTDNFATDYKASMFYGLLIVAIFVLGYLLGAFYFITAAPYNGQSYLFVYANKRKLNFSIVFFLITIVYFIGVYGYFSVNEFSIYDFFSKKFIAEEGKSRLSDPSYLFYRLMLFVKYLFYIMLFWFININHRSNKGLTFIMIVFFTLSSIVPLYFGNRAGFVLFVVDVFLILVVFKKISIYMYIFFGTLVFFVFLLSSFIRPGGEEMGIFDHFFLGRYLVDIQFLSVLYKYLSVTNNYYLGSSLTAWLFLILRPFGIEWSNSFLLLGNKLSVELYDQGFNSVPPSIIGELYLNFSYPGVFLGGIGVGALLNFTWLKFKKSSSLFFKFLFPMLIFRMSLFLFNNDLGTTAIKIATDIIFLYVLLKVVFKEKNMRIVV